MSKLAPTHGFVGDLESAVKENQAYRRVIFTGPHLQLVAMALKPGQAIGEEVHPDTDQFIRVEKGHGRAVLEGESRKIGDDDAVLVPAGVRHDILNTGDKPLRLYTLYAPPHHPADLVELERPLPPQVIES